MPNKCVFSESMECPIESVPEDYSACIPCTNIRLLVADLKSTHYQVDFNMMGLLAESLQFLPYEDNDLKEAIVNKLKKEIILYLDSISEKDK